MAVATKAAAFGVLLRLFDVALIDDQATWGPALAALATVTIVVGNVGALGQSSLKRMLAYSSVAQAGYMLAGVVVATQARRPGDRPLPGRLPADERGRLRRDRRPRARDRRSATTSTPWPGSGRERPLLAWPMTLAMLCLAGIPATAGFIGKVYLIDAAVDGGYTWLGRGDRDRLDDLARLLPARHRRDLDARGAREPSPSRAHVLHSRPVGCLRSRVAPPSSTAKAGEALVTGSQPEVLIVALLAGAGVLFFGVIPQPLFDLVHHVGSALGLF